MNLTKFSNLTLSNNNPNLETLPEVIIGEILTQLTNITGTKGVVNPADIPVIIRYANRLARTSKRMATNMNTLLTTQLFLNSLSLKYKQSPQDLAVQLNTKGAHEWLWNHIKENQYDQVYEVIQAIRTIASQILEEAKANGLDCHGVECVKEDFFLNPRTFQTKQGFLLYNGWMPESIATPFGKIKIFCFYSDKLAFSVSERLIERLNATFEKIDSERFQNTNEFFFEIEASHSHKIREVKEEEKKTIEAKDIPSKRKTQNIICHSLDQSPNIYRINQIANIVLPDPIWEQSKENLLSYELIKCIWNMFKLNEKKDSPKIDLNKKQTTSSFPPLISHLFNNLSEVTSCAIHLINQLIQQPLFRGESQSLGEIKTLIVEDIQMIRTLNVLNTISHSFMKEEEILNMSPFGLDFNNPLRTNGEDIGSGLELYLRSSDEYKNYNLKNLETVYQLIVKSISCNWKKADFKDHADLLVVKSEETHVLFVKEKTHHSDEDDLLRTLAKQLGIFTFIQCDYKRKGTLKSALPYLWIRKDKLTEVLNALEIQPI